MSQVTFTVTFTVVGEVEVMGGWDRPLKEFYLTVFGVPKGPDEDEEIIWSAINEPAAEDQQGTTRLRAKLVELGITPPAGFWEKVELREGNVQRAFVEGAWVP